ERNGGIEATGPIRPAGPSPRLAAAWKRTHDRSRSEGASRGASELAADDQHRCPACRGDVRRHIPRAAADRLPAVDDPVLHRDRDPALPAHHQRDDALLPRLVVRAAGSDRRGHRLLGDVLDPPAMALAQGGIISVGVTLALVGLVVHFVGVRWIEVTMPPVVTGAIVALIGLNLAPAAWDWVRAAPLTAVVTIAAVLLTTVLFRGMLGRLSILIGVLVGYGAAWLQGQIDFSTVSEAAWVGLPSFHAPAFDLGYLGLFLPVVLVLIAENIGHVKSVAAMTGRDLDSLTGRTLFADGVATALAGSGGGSGTTTYAENIGVMAATRIFSTAAYLCAAIIAFCLSLLPKFGEIIATIPAGVLGGAATVLYGMIGMLGVRIWVENRVDFSNPINLNTAAVSLIVAIANFTWTPGGLQFEGIALGTASAIIVYQVMKAIARWRGTDPDAVVERTAEDARAAADAGSRTPPVPGSST